MRALPLDQTVESIRDRPIATGASMLVEQGSVAAVMTHPLHQLASACASLGRHRVARMT
jgi:hypothetical protein